MYDLGSNKNITLVRYTYIIFFLIILNQNKIAVSILCISILLLFMINNQVRLFYLNFQKNTYVFCVSIIAEFIMALYLANFNIKCSGILFLPILIDITLLYPAWCSLLFLMAVIAAIMMIGQFDSVPFVAIIMIPVWLLMLDLKAQGAGKALAQDLYDELREKELELEHALSELKSHANTIEEIAVLRERNRISREIHDNVGHSLSTMIIQLGAIEKIAQSNGNAAAEMAGQLTEFAKNSLQDVRCAVRALRPREFDEYEEIIIISEMIKNFKKLTNIDVVMKVSENKWKINSDQAMAIYRVIQEFLSNSLRHGKASQVTIFLNFSNENLRLYLKDNGTGCDEIIYGVGMKSMSERIAILGGTLQHKSSKMEGFETVIILEKGKTIIDESNNS